MTLQQLYDKYCKNHICERIKEVVIITQDKLLNPTAKRIRINDFFNFDVHNKITDTKDYTELDEAEIELNDESYEKDFGDDGVLTYVNKKVLYIKLKERDLLLSDYIDALNEAKKQLSLEKVEFLTLQHDYEEIKDFFTRPSCTRIMSDNIPVLNKVIYNVRMIQHNNGNIYDMLVDGMKELIEGMSSQEQMKYHNVLKLIDAGSATIDEQNKIAEDMVKIVEDNVSERSVQEVYGLDADDEVGPDNESIVDDYFDTIVTDLVGGLELDDFYDPVRSAGVSYLKYTDALKRYNRAKQNALRAILVETTLTSDGAHKEDCILQQYSFFEDILEVN